MYSVYVGTYYMYIKYVFFFIKYIVEVSLVWTFDWNWTDFTKKKKKLSKPIVL